jgi:hypothetical protein
MARAFKPQMATGNALLEGDVVYFTSAGEWSRDIGDAAVAVSAEAAADLLARAQTFPDQVVGVYLADVALDDSGRAAPAHFREAFRTRGP